MSMFDAECDFTDALAALDWRKVNVPQILLAEMADDGAEEILDSMNPETAAAHMIMWELEWLATATSEQYWRAIGL